MRRISFYTLRSGISYRIHVLIDAIKSKILKRLYKYYVESYFYQPRKYNRTREYKEIVRKLNLPELSRQEILEIKQYWKRFGIKPDMNCYRYYYHLTGNHDPRFIQDSVFQTKIEDFFIDQHMASKLDDKNMYDVYFQKRENYELPETLIHKMSGDYLDSEYKYISEESALDLCLKSDSDLVVKKSIDSSGGHGVFVWHRSENSSKLIEVLKGWKDFIVQKFITQHPFYSAINPTSINTLRIMSATIKGELVIISSVLRMGAPNSELDNYSSGGFMCGIDENGKLRRIGYRNNRTQYLSHPNGFVFEGQELPGYWNCVNVVKENAYRFMNVSKLIAWDFAIGEDETPILIEVNLNLVHVCFNQMANGPIFGDRTEEFLQTIFKS